MATTLERIKNQPNKPRRALTDRAVANLFLLPTVLLLVALNIFPLLWSLYLSFCKYTATDANTPVKWIGNANYVKLLGSVEIWNNFRVTAQFTILSVVAQLIVGFGMALLLNRTFKAKGIITTLILLPMMLSPVVVGKFWNFLFETNIGLINWMLQTAHLQDPIQPINWLSDDRFSMWAMVIVDTWMWSPFVMLISLAGLNSVPPHLYEAAEVDRASGWFKFRHITLPMVAPLVMIALLFRTIDCLKIFDLVKALSQGPSTQTVSYALYKHGFDFHDTGFACAFGYVLLLIIIGLTNLYLKYLASIRGEGIPDATPLFGSFSEKTANVPILGWLTEAPARLFVLVLAGAFWRQLLDVVLFVFAHPALLIAIAIAVAAGVGIAYIPQKARNVLALVAICFATFAYLAPILWIGITSLKPSTQIMTAYPPKFIPTHMATPGEPPAENATFGISFANYDNVLYKRQYNKADGKIEGYSDLMKQLGGSLLVGVVSTFLAVALGTLAAYAFARFNIKGKGDLLFFILSTRMMPAIVVVIPIFLMFSRLNLTDSLLGLVILYTVFNLSFSTYLLKGFFDDIPHEYDDAALLDGYSRIQTFLKISLPQAMTGIAATAVFCFITAWNEFAFSQILSSAQPLTAPPSIISLTGSGGTAWGPIAAGAVVFLIPAALFTFIMRKHLLRGVTFGAIKK